MGCWISEADFSDSFLITHHDLVLRHTYHQAQTWMLYPCGCQEPCVCAERRAQMLLSLNATFCTKSEEHGFSPQKLAAMRMLFRLPDGDSWRRQFGEAYPLWLIAQNIAEKAIAFKAVGLLAWMLIRLAHHPQAWRRRASIRQAMPYLIGEGPLKSSNKSQYLGGEKAYARYLKTYRWVCAFITAFEKFKEMGKDPWQLDDSHDIETLLGHVHFIRRELLFIDNAYIRDRQVFAPDSLLSPPTWVRGVPLMIEPLDMK